jgi:hypothetical protein
VAQYILITVAAVSLVAHFLASSVAYFLLRQQETLTEQLFSFPVQVPANVGLLRLKYFFPFVRFPAAASEARRVLPWLSVARYTGFLFLCAAVGFIVSVLVVNAA